MDKKLEKIFDLKLDASDRDTERHGLIQYDYGQILRIHGLDLPPAVEIQFSYREKGGVTENRIGTTKDGVTEVQIPDAMLKNNGTTQDYAIWVFIYVTDETSGNTVYRIKLYVDSRPAPGEIGEDPEEKRILDEAVNAVNAAAERAETAEAGARSAADSATAAAESARKSAEAVAQEKNTAISAIQNQQTAAEKAITDHTDAEIGRLDRETQESEDRLTETIRTANDTKEAAENTISEARRVKESLDISVQNATKGKEAVEASTSTANAAKKNLDQSTADANVAKTALDKTIQSADDQNTSLGEKIETSKQLKTDLQTAGEKATQDIQTAGSEQLGKMQAVAEEFTADREQITTNKEDIGSLKEDLGNKITKFYASNQGETHITDSDNGKIEDMVLYGRSEQKQYSGKNLLKIRDGAQTTRGVTVTAKDGVFSLKGTATEKGWAALDIDSFVLDGTYILSSNISNINVFAVNKSFKSVLQLNNPATVDNAEVSKVCFTVIEGKTYDISNILIQIEKGTEATSYEPYVGGQPSPSPDYPQEIKSVVNPTVKVSNEDGTKSQTVTLPYTLNAIPVSSGGNVTIDGQQWVCDEVDLARGVKVQRVKVKELSPDDRWAYQKLASGNNNFQIRMLNADVAINGKPCFCNILPFKNTAWNDNIQNLPKIYANNQEITASFPPNSEYSSLEAFKQMLTDVKSVIYYILDTPIETTLTTDEIAAFNAFTTYYPVTNISVNSEQLDGYTVFNYPISMQNGWNYVKQQLNDNRDYIYDMDIQSAEAYVNSEYAVALTEFEV